MAFIWRRRSTSIVKIVAILTAIWFFVAFFIYTDDTRRETASNKWSAMSQQLKSLAAVGGNSINNAGASALANNQLNDFEHDAPAGAFEAGGGFGVGNNVVLERNSGHKKPAPAEFDEDGGGEAADGDGDGEGMAADVPIAQPDEPHNAEADGGGGDDDNADVDINEGDESILNNVVVHPNEKVYHGKLVAGNNKPSGNDNAHQQVDDGEFLNLIYTHTLSHIYAHRLSFINIKKKKEYF